MKCMRVTGALNISSHAAPAGRGAVASQNSSMGLRRLGLPRNAS
jgi:hypothetical protein